VVSIKICTRQQGLLSASIPIVLRPEMKANFRLQPQDSLFSQHRRALDTAQSDSNRTSVFFPTSGFNFLLQTEAVSVILEKILQSLSRLKPETGRFALNDTP